MFKRSCRCGKQTKNFKYDIGPFFITQCCVDAGYDHLGNKKSEVDPKKDLGLSETETAEILAGDTGLTEVIEPIVKKRQYNKNGNIKKPL